ncbi:hypothetical protein I5372_14100 [Citrobacter freundii]|uniref:hypothetical protein n=1 Tax=Citrobacter freundii complex TaxID=1344959 RepID=UPI00132FC2D9|nr:MULTISPECIES: hypothetical protein [Citrobacter freundii complex]MBJ8732389.1 hypothetical protein [Citrobacter freundii]
MKRIKSLIIDTNLLLLLVIGQIEGGRHIRNSSRLKKYSLDDFDKILDVMQKADDVFITPYIATEVSNLIDLNGYILDEAMQNASTFFNTFSQISGEVSTDSLGLFVRYGITDNSLINLVKDYTILTDDLRLANELFTVKHDHVLLLEHL